MILKTLRYDIDQGIATINFDEQGSPVNTMCLQWQDDLAQVAQELVKDRPKLQGVILASSKSTFFAGADLKGVMRSSAADGPRVFVEIERIKKNFRTIETLGIPVVSCLNGSALGGGWELALVGHYRIATRNPKMQFGLPEVTLGLIPGGGGITKMTRALGLLAAQPYILESQLFGPEQSLKLGLVHELVSSDIELRKSALAFIASSHHKPEACQHIWDRKDYQMPGGTPHNPKLAGILSLAPAALKQKTRGLYPAPEAALAAMVEGALVDFDTAMRIESRYLASLMTSGTARNMINTVFFNMNSIKSGLSRPAGVSRYRPQKVGILGAGLMGSGIAYSQASRGIASVLKDVTIEKAEKGKAYSLLVSQKLLEKGSITAEQQATLLNLIQATDKQEDLKGCDLIIEAVFEQRDVHFFSPVEKMKLVEIIRGEKTDDETIARAYDYVQALGKLPIVVNDSRGFYTSRTFATFVMEGAAMLGEGIPAPVIENLAMQVGMPVGPLAVIDETALTLSLHVLEQTRVDFKNEGCNYEASPGELLVERMVNEFKRGGRAAGGGFYDYPPGQKKMLWSELKKIFENPHVTFDVQDIKDRILFRQAIETARCLEEGVLTSVHEGNIGSIFGIGYPAWTGGALQFIYSMGVPNFAKRSQVLAAQFGDGFNVSKRVLETLEKYKPIY